MARKSVFDDMIKRSTRFNKDSGKAFRKGLKSSRKKGKGKKRAKRNERHIEALAGQLQEITQQLAVLTAVREERDRGAVQHKA
ncbi:hypothetical protein ACH4Y0_35450 [Streptomyces sp. NPDC020707]|jgi:hypothetical protein|uniref:30S ribosomal protein S20 n=1 Tax=Streptomyces ortus TaxID=2867268 RepID=A0ABT3VK21_9ACTN|nr:MULTISPECIES: hypothetical protein [Streptomyces]MCX4238861.1 hypothetical protein [Streptomyces ortus]